MKKKILVFTLCFTLIFSSLNYKKSYADGGIISLPILGVVSSLAVATGIAINNSDDLYDIGRIFYDYIDRHNELTWATVQSVFSASVALQPNNLVSVKSDFLDIVSSFFDDMFNKDDVKYVGSYYNIPVYPSYLTLDKQSLYAGDSLYIEYTDSNGFQYYYSYWNGIRKAEKFSRDGKLKIMVSPDLKHLWWEDFYGSNTYCVQNAYVSDSVIGFPYSGGYTWDNVNDRLNENDELPLPIPGNLGHLVGQGSSDFWDNTTGLVGQGGLSIPGVDSPSIGVDSSVNTFPGVSNPGVPGVDSPSVPNEGIWATIKDFIIGLVVPSDMYWTDTWGGLYNNFTSSFPMVDMDGFNDLVTGEKKFPNIDINIMGVSGRVVNGDVINSIVDWLRPIIAGFMMLCLMLFNYRKIYKLIRNSEPFGGIAPGTSDFRTGISEYNKEPVIKAVDMAAEYRAWKENGGK